VEDQFVAVEQGQQTNGFDTTVGYQSNKIL